MASFDRCLKTLAHRFAFVRDDARIQRDAALPRARCSRFRVITRMCPTDFCQPLTLPLLHPRSWFPTLLDPPSKGWGDRRVRRFTTRWTRFGGSYGDEEGCWPSRVVVVHFVHPKPSALSRSTHDFASGGSSPSGTRLRLPRSACVESEGSRPFPSTLSERGDLSRSETPSFVTASLFVQSSSPRVSSDDARVVHPLLALRFACARGGQEMFDAEVCNLNTTRGHDRRSSSLPFPRVGPSSDARQVVVPFRATHPGKPRRSAPPSGTRLATRQNIPLRVERVSGPHRLLLRARLTRATGREKRRVAPGCCVRQRSPPLFHLTPPGSAFFRRVAERPETTSRRATWAEACESEGPVRPLLIGEEKTRRVPLLAGGPEHPLSSPRVRAWLELPRTSWRCKPGATEILVRPTPREGDGVPEDQGAWNRSVSRVR